MFKSGNNVSDFKFSRVNSVFLYTSRKDGATKGKVKNNKQLPLFRM